MYVYSQDILLTDVTQTVTCSEYKQRFWSSLEQCPDDVTSAYVKTITGLARHAMLPPIQDNEDEGWLYLRCCAGYMYT